MRTNMVGDKFKGIRGEAPGHGFGVLVRTIVDAPNCGCSRSAGAFGWYGAYGTVSWTDPASELVAVLMLQQNDYSVHLDYERLIREAIVA
jgi:CubicO group peptidase (beta-lactamase class C family)